RWRGGCNCYRRSAGSTSYSPRRCFACCRSRAREGRISRLALDRGRILALVDRRHRVCAWHDGRVHLMIVQQLAIVRLGLASLLATAAGCSHDSGPGVDASVPTDLSTIGEGDGFDLPDGDTTPPDPPLPACVRTVNVANSTALNAATAVAQP